MTKKNKRIKSKLWIKLIVSVIFIGIVVSCAPKGENVVFSINDVDVVQDEWAMFLQEEKALTVSYFYNTYGAEYSGEFWEEQFEQEIPIEVARRQAMDKFLRVKIEQMIAVEYGKLDTMVYSKIKKQFEEEESIYGAETLSLFQKYMLFHSKIILKTKEAFKSQEPEINIEKLKQQYMKDYDANFAPQDNMKILQVKISGREDVEKEELKTLVDRVVLDLQEGITIKSLREKYKEAGLIASIKEYGEHESKDESSSEIDQKLKEEGYKLEENEMSLPLWIEDQVYILVSLEREEGEEKAFEDVRVAIEDALYEEDFERLVLENIKKAQIKIYDKEYNQVTIK